MKYLIKNLKAHSLKFLSIIFIQIIFPPFMIFFWGKENFNLWLFLFAIPSIFSFFQISITSPVRNEMYKFFKRGRINDLIIYFQNSFYLVLLNVILISFIAFVYLFFNENKIYIDNLGLVIIVFFILFLNLINSNAYTLLTYKGNYSVFIKIEIFFSLAIALILPFSIYLTDDFNNIFSLRLLIEVIKTLTLYNFGKSNLKFNLIKNIKLVNYKYLKKIIYLSLGYSFDVLSNLVKGPGIIFLMGLNNLNLVGILSTSRTMFYYFPLRFLTIFEKSFYLEYNNILNSKILKKKFKTTYKKLFIFLVLVSIFHFSISMTFGVFFYKLWLNSAFVINNNLIILIVCDSIFVYLGWFIILPFKSIHKTNKPAFFELIINILLFLFIITFQYTDLISIYKTILISSIIIFLIKLYYSIILYRKYAL